MTVAELLDHFDVSPSQINFYDSSKNADYTIYRGQYDAFIDEYGDRKVTGWYVFGDCDGNDFGIRLEFK